MEIMRNLKPVVCFFIRVLLIRVMIHTAMSGVILPYLSNQDEVWGFIEGGIIMSIISSHQKLSCCLVSVIGGPSFSLGKLSALPFIVFGLITSVLVFHLVTIMSARGGGMVCFLTGGIRV